MHKTMFKITIFILLLLAASGCGAGTTTGQTQRTGEETSAPGTAASAHNSAGQPSSPDTSGIASANTQSQGDTMETREPPAPSSQDGNTSSSSGASSTPPVVSNAPSVPNSQPPATAGEPGTVSGAPGTISVGGLPAQTPPDTAATPSQWLTYTDQTYGFSISYPDTYVILDKPSSRETPPPGLVHQVLFQDKQLASGATADLEPPRFRVEIFDNTSGVSLDQWLSDHQVSGTRTTAQVGKQEGVHVSLNTLMAPNQFYYVTRGAHVYRLTPLGEYSLQIVDSFTLH